MQKLGRILVTVGLVATAVFLIVGFTTMLMGRPEAKFFLMLIPLGFLTLFTGVVTVVMTGEPSNPHTLD